MNRGARADALGSVGETPSDVFLALAFRCETEEPSRQLDREIAIATGSAWQAVRHGSHSPPLFTDSLDAAVALIADGVEWSVSTIYHIARAEVGLNLNEGPHYGEHKGALVAMSICAAALRARAAVAESASLPEATKSRSTSDSHPNPNQRGEG